MAPKLGADEQVEEFGDMWMTPSLPSCGASCPRWAVDHAKALEGREADNTGGAEQQGGGELEIACSQSPSLLADHGRKKRATRRNG